MQTKQDIIQVQRGVAGIVHRVTDIELTGGIVADAAKTVSWLNSRSCYVLRQIRVLMYSLVKFSGSLALNRYIESFYIDYGETLMDDDELLTELLWKIPVDQR